MDHEFHSKLVDTEQQNKNKHYINKFLGSDFQEETKQALAQSVCSTCKKYMEFIYNRM